MADRDLEHRLRAVERAIAGDNQLPDLAADAELVARVDDATADVDDLSARLDTLDAAVQAVRGYVGHVEHVNERVERRADAACAAVDRLEDVIEAEQDTTAPTSTAGESVSSQNPVMEAGDTGLDWDQPSETSSTSPTAPTTDEGTPDGLLARLRTLL